MGRSILLTRVSDGSVKAFNKRVPAPPVTDRIGMRHRAPALVPLPRMDLRPRRQPRRRARQGGVPESSSRSAKLTQLPATEYAGFLWLALDRQTPLDVAAHLGPLGDELDSWDIGRWSPLGGKVLDSPINWKLAIDTFAENYHFATVHKTTLATIARSNCTVFDSFGPHHRLVFPLNGICDLEGVPEHQWDPLQNMVVIYALFPHRVVGDGGQRRTVPGVPGRCAGAVDHRAPELDTAGRVRRVGGGGRASGLRLRPCEGAGRGLSASRGSSGEPGVRRARSCGVRPQRTWAAAPPLHVVAGNRWTTSVTAEAHTYCCPPRSDSL
jgi:hypothetical protein